MGDGEVRRRRKGKKDGSPVKKSTSASTGTSENTGSSGLRFLLVTSGILGTLAFGYYHSPLNPVEIDLPPVLKFEGSLKVNDVLEKGERIIPGSVGPESIEIDDGGNIYTGLAGGRVIKVHPSATGAIGEGLVEDIRNGPIPGVKPVDGHTEARPLGIRLHGDYLYVIDAYYGVYSLNLKTKEVRPLVKPDDVQPSMKFPNDLDITKDGKYIYFTDASLKWNLKLLYNDFAEGKCEGRLFRLTVATLEVKVLAGKLCFANGVQLSDDEKTVVVAETSRYRVLFIDVKTGKVESVITVPGMPDNIRSSRSGGYWVAVPIRRSWFFDNTASFPLVRKIISGLVPLQLVVYMSPTWSGLAVELDSHGKIIRSIHDNNGETSRTVSEVSETKDGILLAGSYKEPYLVKVKP